MARQTAKAGVHVAQTPANKLGAFIKAARLRGGFSIQGLARASDVDASMISRLETGARDNPDFRTISKLAGVLGFSIDAAAIEAGLLNGKALYIDGNANSEEKLKQELHPLRSLLARASKLVEKHLGEA